MAEKQDELGDSSVFWEFWPLSLADYQDGAGQGCGDLGEGRGVAK